MKKILPKGSRVVTAWAERCSGPGWTNTPVWVLIQDSDGGLRVESLQPMEQSASVRLLHGVSATCAETMTREVMECFSPEEE